MKYRSSMQQLIRKLPGICFIILGIAPLCWVSNSYATIQPSYVWMGGKKELVRINALSEAIELSRRVNEKTQASAIDDSRKIVWLASKYGRLTAYNFNGEEVVSVKLPYYKNNHYIKDDDKKDDDDYKHKSKHHVKIEDIVVDKRDGSVWVAGKKAIYQVLNTGEIAATIPQKRKIKKLALDIGSGVLWLASEKHIFSVSLATPTQMVELALSPLSCKKKKKKKEYDSDDSKNKSKNKKNKDDDECKHHAEIKDINFDLHLGMLWVGEKKRVLLFSRAGELQLQFKVKRLKHLSSDGSGNIWIAGEKEVMRFSVDGALQFSKRLKSSEIESIYANVNDTSLWVLTHKSVFHVHHDGTVNKLPAKFKHYETITVNGDVNPPVVTIDSPQADSLITRRPEITLQFSDIGVGADYKSVKLAVNNEAVSVTCTGNMEQATCIPTKDLLEFTLNLSITVNDFALNTSAAATVTVKLDTDGDGVADDRDTYPEDPTRWRLAAVTDVNIALQATTVLLKWAQHIDPPNTQGFNIYRQTFGETNEIKLNTNPISSLEYIDGGIQNGTGYLYRVVAVDKRNYEGEPGTQLQYFVAYNITPVSGTSAIREKADGRIVWSNLQGFRYQLYRGIDGEPINSLIGLTEATYLDTNALWNIRYRYQIATIAGFVNVFTNQILTIIGPRSAEVILEPLPPLGISIDNASLAADGVYEIIVTGSDRMALIGNYTEAVGPVDITATFAGDNLSAVSNDGSFRIMFPVTSNAQWGITISEQTVANRVVATQVRLIKDTQAPTLTIDGAASRSIDTDYIILTGNAVDTHSEITELYVESDRYAGQPFGVIQGADGNFSVEVPLEYGDNILTVYAIDQSDNTSSKVVSVKRASSLLPKLQISTPLPGSAFYTNDRITVTGVVYTTLAPEQVKIILGGEIQFPSQTTTSGAYPFTFSNVQLADGYNRIIVDVETPAGKDSANTVVFYASVPPAPEEIPAPQIYISSLRGTGYYNDDSVIIAGNVTSTVGVNTLSVNGIDAPLSGQSVLSKTFQYELNLLSYGANVPVTVIATDTVGKTTTLQLNLNRDTTAPVISVSNPDLQPAPAVNRVVEQPYRIYGTVTDINLAGFTINGQNVGLIPTTSGAYDFSASLFLPTALDYVVLIEARDLAGNSISNELIFNADIPVQFEVISPKEGDEIISSATGAQIQVTARLTGLVGTETVSARIDAEPAQNLLLDGNIASTVLNTTLSTGEHTIYIDITDATGARIAATSVPVTLKDKDSIPLQVVKIEPENGQKYINTDDPITVYFNKTIDPAKLVITVKESVHGFDYDLSNQQGVDFTELPEPKLVEVHRDMEPVTGGLALFPGNMFVSFHASRRFAYDANVFVSINYDGQELLRSTYKIRDLPTLASGLLQDQYVQPVAGVEVKLDELGLTSITDANGNFSFGYGLKAEKNIPGGRYRLLINEGLKNIRYGSHSTWVNFQQGRLTELEPYRVTQLNPKIPFVFVNSGQADIIMASGNLVLDLSNADITLPDGRNQGNVHVQFLTTPELTVSTTPGAIPLSMYNVQPGGTTVRGEINLKMKMPLINGSFDYIPDDGTLVLMLAYNADAEIIEPIGLGQITQQHVENLSALRVTHLNYLGYAIVDEELQPLLQDYQQGSITFTALKNALEDAVLGAGP